MVREVYQFSEAVTLRQDFTSDQASLLAAVEKDPAYDRLKRLAGDRGVFFYARGYGRLKTAVKGLLESFQHIGVLHLPPPYAHGPVTLSFAGQSVTLP